jgi:[ribosomal protein S18]-alanine N-acetyltransferase
VNIRPARPADLEGLLALEREAVSAAHWGRAEYERLLSPPPGADGSARLALVAEEEETPLAFLIARDLGVEWELENMAVASVARRRGLGSLLVGELTRRARACGAQAVFLEVRQSNAAARAFYEKSGFLPTGRRPGYYDGPREDALVYRLPVGGPQMAPPPPLSKND